MAINEPWDVLLDWKFAAHAQVRGGIVLASVLLPSCMTAIGISELPTSSVLTAMLVSSGGMLLTGLVACGLPARRALRIQPTEAGKCVG